MVETGLREGRQTVVEDWDYVEMIKGKPFERIQKAKRRIHLRQERTHCFFHKWITICTRQTVSGRSLKTT